ncbi:MULTISPECIES: NAD(P)/FAD-dependent oxidoreductase [Bradyrhizobium]|uniref:NAD(P)/FAD-dependent oxidoreductase n=1 Tax=Bradyrhizobium elkanii TaxID=29448 RepID=UPI002714D3F6|nr:FAD-dependent oxidoreductase [Bradyrhizobium elkanii]WLA48784.1 FAD-dependent oxidoreductase [Bradyrhizobium elkanii]WLB80989.1 FAD-dependent oxidoreductase [Bradyrhizobium elkanii]
MNGLVVIGASYAGIQAALTAREAGYAEPVTVIADESALPYQRPPLSKDFLLDEISAQGLLMHDEAIFSDNRIELCLGNRVVGIDRSAGRVVLAGGAVLDFERLVIATGSRARRIAIRGVELDGVCYLRSIADAGDLKARLGEASEIAIVGGGFIGLEVASSAARLGKKVTVIEAASRLLERAVSPVVSRVLLDRHVRAGVAVKFSTAVSAMIGDGGRVVAVELNGGVHLGADLVVVGIGGIANDELAVAAGLDCTNGIVVDEHGRTACPGIYAAGDCANHYSRFAAGWIRLESVQHAQDQGRSAGLAIAESHEPYDSVPRFWSDQHDLKLQIVGHSARSDRIVIRGAIEAGRFSVFNYRQGKLVAVDSINNPTDQMVARRLIAAGISPTPEQAADSSCDLKSLLKAGNKAVA